MKKLFISLAIVGTMFTTSASANPIEECGVIGDIVMAAAQERDSGTPEKVLVDGVFGLNMTQDDKNFLLVIVRSVYNNPRFANKSPSEIAGDTFMACVENFSK